MNTEITKDCTVFANQLPCFGSEAFLSCKSSDYGWFSNSHFVLPFFIDKRLIFRRLIFTSNIVYLKGTTSSEDLQVFINQVSALAKKQLKVDFIATPLASAKFPVFPEHSIHSKYWTYIVDLEEPEEDILKKISSRLRTNIRSSTRKQYVTEKTTDVDSFMKLLSTTYKRSNASMLLPSQDFITCLLKNLKENSSIFQVLVDNEPQAAALIVYDKDRAYYYYGASLDRPAAGSIPFMHWSILNLMKSKGIKYYDFMGVIANAPEGSKDHGILNFKRKFGGLLEEAFIFKVIYSPVKYQLFNWAVKIVCRLKGERYTGDVIDRILINAE